MYYSFARILPLAWLSTLTVPGGTGHQLEVPTRKADPAPPRARSGDLTEVKGAHTPAGRSATPTPPHAGEQQCQRQPGVSPTWAVTASVLSSRRPPAHTPPHTSNPRGNFSGCPSNSGFTSVDSMTSGVLGFLVSPPPQEPTALIVLSTTLLGMCDRGHYGHRGASPWRKEPRRPGDLRLHTRRPARAPSPPLPRREQCGRPTLRGLQGLRVHGEPLKCVSGECLGFARLACLQVGESRFRDWGVEKRRTGQGRSSDPLLITEATRKKKKKARGGTAHARGKAT